MKKLALTLIAASTFVGAAFASSISIPNFSFETAYSQDNSLLGIGNWSQPAGPAGITGAVGGLTPTDGSLFLFINGPSAGGPGVVYQRLNILAAGTYNFQVDVGFRSDLGGSVGNSYDIAFYAVNPGIESNDSTLARQITTAPAPGTWVTENFSFTVTGNESWFATDVIQLTLTAPTGIQVGFDNIRGTFTPEPVPEPSTFALLGLSGTLLLWRSRQRKDS